jgi:hypothetical protein
MLATLARFDSTPGKITRTGTPPPVTSANPIREGQILAGSLFNEPMRVETVRAEGSQAWVVGLVGIRSEQFRRVTLRPSDLDGLTVAEPGLSYDGDASPTMPARARRSWPGCSFAS